VIRYLLERQLLPQQKELLDASPEDRSAFRPVHMPVTQVAGLRDWLSETTGRPAVGLPASTSLSRSERDEPDVGAPVGRIMERRLFDMEFDAFISYASEDREALARPLYKLLTHIARWMDIRWTAAAGTAQVTAHPVGAECHMGSQPCGFPPQATMQPAASNSHIRFVVHRARMLPLAGRRRG